MNTTLRKPTFVKVAQLEPTSKGENVVVKVIEFKTVVERTRPNGSKIRIAEAVVGDETGIVTMSVRNEQLDLLKPGAYLDLRNTKIEMFQGFMRLTVDRWGKISTASDHKFKTNNEKNVSGVEYEPVY